MIFSFRSRLLLFYADGEAAVHFALSVCVHTGPAAVCRRGEDWVSFGDAMALSS